MFKNKLPLLLPIFLLLLTQCRPLQNEKITEVDWDFSDPEVVKLYNWQDQQNLDSLLVYFNDPNPTYRYGVAMAFGSFKEKAAIDSLVMLLDDEVVAVRTAAAYALGQIGEEKAEKPLIGAFMTEDSLGIGEELNSTILEAIGKCASENQLKNLSTISTYLRSDTTLLEGQARGLYQYALRGMIMPDGTSRMVDFVVRRGYPQSVRLIAANYLARAKNVILDSLALGSLSKTMAQDTDPNIRMALAVALGKTKTPAALNAIQNRFAIEKDYRVKCNIIRAFSNFDYKAVEPFLTPVLDDKNQHVANTVANYFINHGNAKGASVYWRKAKDTTLHQQTQMMLYEAANKYFPAYFEVGKKQITRELKNILATAKDPYKKAGALKALSQYNWNYRFLKDQNFDGEEAIVRTASVEALAKIARDPGFVSFFGSSGSRKVKRDLADVFEEVIVKGDPAMTAVAAGVLREPALEFKNYLDSLDFLKTTLDKLSLPREVETWNELQKTIDYFNGKEDTELVQLPFNHPIDWELYKSIPNDAKAEIKTRKGTIVLQLFPDKAPGTVVNFVQLGKNGFFNGKNFHRIVPNFVIQGGCPRGDGFGALDYTIRSELPPIHYDQDGFVGMASSGNHTECTQFFITHSPTFHLDGNYTIFAKVIEGMDIVHLIEQSDIIESVSVL